MSNYEINILHIFPDLLNLYGDKGNICCLKKRLSDRGIDVNVNVCEGRKDTLDITGADIIFIGGGSDHEMKIVSELLLEKKAELTDYAESEGVMLAVCGGYQLLGKYYQTNEDKIEGLGILDICTEPSEKRFIGNVVLKSDIVTQPVVGFENHGAITKNGEYTPLGRVEHGYGNDGMGNCEGVIYKNVIGTYLHGPLLPKNPQLCDYILTCALKKKYPDFQGLEPLDDSLENMANDYVVNKVK